MNKENPGKEEIHVFEEKTFSIPEGDSRHDFTKGDLVVTCHNCGEENLLQQSIEHGIQVILPTDNWHEVRLTCGRCNSALSLHFVVAADGGEIKVVEDATVRELQAEADITDAEIAAETVTEGRVIDINTKEEITHEKTSERLEAEKELFATSHDDIDKYDIVDDKVVEIEDEYIEVSIKPEDESKEDSTEA